MMIMPLTNDFNERWDSLWSKPGETSYQRIDASHPLDFYIGHDIKGDRELMLLLDYEPQQIISSRSVHVDIGKRQDNKWAVRFRLMLPEQEVVFAQLCWDLIQSSRKQNNSRNGTTFVLMRFQKWQRLMEQGHNGLLSGAVVKGLLGELLFLKQYALGKYNAEMAIDGWLGPLGADRDFVYGSMWHEIKTVSPGVTVIKISSMEQLDVEEEGQLIITLLERTSASATMSITLPGIVSDLRTIFSIYPSALDRFEEKLLHIGYIDRKEYEDEHYVYRGTRYFRVCDGFPRIRKTMLSPCITGLSYELAIASLDDWEIFDEGMIADGTA
jgi:hypothetical protein